MLDEHYGVVNLIPFGQNVADQCRGITLNETGVRIWSLLAAPQDAASLADALANEFMAGPEDMDELRADMQAFLEQLELYGLIREANRPFAPESPFHALLTIGGLSVALHGPAAVFPDEFAPFLRPGSSVAPDMTIDLVFRSDHSHHRGEVLLRNEVLIVYRDAEVWSMFFPEFTYITEVTVSLDARSARLYLRHDSVPCPACREEVLHALRHLFLLRAAQAGLFAMHSVSILYRDKVWLFSGHAGMGKSTHTRLWQEHVGTPILNGDLNLLAIDPATARPMVHALPWCGTSGISTPGCWELGGIVLLDRALNDYTEPLSPDQRLLQTTQRLISPVWTADMLRANLAFMDRVTSSVPVFKLRCTKEPSAVDTIRHEIDAWYDSQGTML